MIHNKKDDRQTETVNYRNGKNHFAKRRENNKKTRIRKEFNTMSRYAGTKTEKNLEAAFSGESQARNKYTYFASVAKKEGYEQIAALNRAREDVVQVVRWNQRYRCKPCGSRSRGELRVDRYVRGFCEDR